MFASIMFNSNNNNNNNNTVQQVTYILRSTDLLTVYDTRNPWHPS
jgi:hypothetical protein